MKISSPLVASAAKGLFVPLFANTPSHNHTIGWLEFMTHTQRGEYWYGDDHADLRAELVRYSAANGYPASDFVDLKCACGGEFFHLLL